MSLKINPFVFDPMDEYDDFFGTTELDSESALLHQLNIATSGDFDCIVVDEAYAYREFNTFVRKLTKAYVTRAHRSETWLIIAQRPHLLPVDIRSLSDATVSFQLDWADDIGVLKGISRELASTVQSLRDHQFVIWQNQQLIRCRNISGGVQ